MPAEARTLAPPERRIAEVKRVERVGAYDLIVARDPIDLHRITQGIQLAPGVQRSSTSIATTEVIAHRMSALLQELAAQEP